MTWQQINQFVSLNEPQAASESETGDIGDGDNQGIGHGDNVHLPTVETPAPKKKRKCLNRKESLEEKPIPEGSPPLKKKRPTIHNMTCLYCDYMTNKKYLLSRHMRCHSNDRPFPCAHKDCDRAFKTQASLQNHVNTHIGVKPHKCKFEGCEASFTTSGELIRHSRYIHTHEKPHKCDVQDCGYESVELSKLKRHLRSHTGERPFQCQHCDYASPDTYKLKRHLRVHTGEKPYECDICHHRFTQSNSMKSHKLTHANELSKVTYKCDHCPATCSRKSDLKTHIQKLHESEEPIVCKKCMRSFPDRYLFNVHRKNTTPCVSKMAILPKGSAVASSATEAAVAQKAGNNREGDVRSILSQYEETVPEPLGDAAASSLLPGTGGNLMTKSLLPDGDMMEMIREAVMGNTLSAVQMDIMQSGSDADIMSESRALEMLPDEGGDLEAVPGGLPNLTEGEMTVSHE